MRHYICGPLSNREWRFSCGIISLRVIRPLWMAWAQLNPRGTLGAVSGNALGSFQEPPASIVSARSARRCRNTGPFEMSRAAAIGRLRNVFPEMLLKLNRETCDDANMQVHFSRYSGQRRSPAGLSLTSEDARISQVLNSRDDFAKCSPFVLPPATLHFRRPHFLCLADYAPSA